MIASILTKLGQRFKFVFGLPTEPDPLGSIGRTIRVIKTIKYLKEARIGLIGYTAAGFHDLAFDEIELKRVVGADLQYVDLARLFKEAEEATPEEIDSAISEIEASVGSVAPEASQAIERVARHHAAMKKLIAEHGFDALAVRCWPEFQTERQCNVCIVNSLLGNVGVPCACEADVDGAALCSLTTT